MSFSLKNTESAHELVTVISSWHLQSVRGGLTLARNANLLSWLNLLPYQMEVHLSSGCCCASETASVSNFWLPAWVDIMNNVFQNSNAIKLSNKRGNLKKKKRETSFPCVVHAGCYFQESPAVTQVTLWGLACSMETGLRRKRPQIERQ